MTSLIGNLLLGFGCLFVAFSLVIIVLAQYNLGKIAFSKIAKYLFIGQSVLTTLSFCVLIYSFYISDFSIQNVFLNSSSITPLIFKISGAWASHEGSILLWYSLLSIVASLCIKNIDNALLPASIFILSPIILGFGMFVYLYSNPFTSLSINSPHQGMGLNPLLQDIALIIHPPILYMGYVSYLAPFLYSCLSLIYPAKSLECVKASMIFSKFGWLMLTIGVGLGSWWAYRELGWGGFWFFDPVENISLLPLISAIAFHHSLIFSVLHLKLIRWTIFFGLTTFLLTLLGTSLVRSGLLTSVHSFADNTGRAQILLWIFMILASFSYGLYIWRINTLASSKLFPYSKEQGVLFGNITWIAILLTLLFAILYPVVLGILGVTISVGTEYFIKTFLPLSVPILLLAGSFAYFKAKNTRRLDFYISALVACLSSFIFYALLPEYSPLIGSAIFGSVFLMVSTIAKLLEKSNYFKAPLSSKMAAMLISHFGYGMMALCITLNSSLQSEFDFIGKRGDVVNTEKYKITLQNITYSQHDNYYRQIVEFWLESSDNKTVILRPENRFYEIEKSITAESDIYSYLTHDLYAVLSKVNGDIIHAKIYYRPCVSLLWISIIIIAGGIFVSLLSKKSNTAAFQTLRT
ncbi:MAG: cytochrome c-type biogenesis CcmF C-terminal domain-containing protein [Pseudomonadota bacterium]